MPAPRRTTLEAIVGAGLALLEDAGPEALTMQAVAQRVGVRAPSLYKRVRSRTDLVRLVTEATVRDLGDRLSLTADGAAPADELMALGRALRAFAHERPAGYHLVFAPAPDGARADPALLAAASAPVLDAVGRLVGPGDALAAARTLTAWAHGFVSMELAGAFRLGGDVDAAFEYGLRAVVGALTPRT